MTISPAKAGQNSKSSVRFHQAQKPYSELETTLHIYICNQGTPLVKDLAKACPIGPTFAAAVDPMELEDKAPALGIGIWDYSYTGVWGHTGFHLGIHELNPGLAFPGWWELMRSS